MHEPIRARLEVYLENPEGVGREFEEHLAECRECAGELKGLAEVSGLVRVLRVSNSDPDPGFYGRVMGRIEEQAKPSVWSILHDTAFGWRVAVASAAMALVMAGYLVTTEPSREPGTSVVGSETSLEADSGSPAQLEQDRDSVLMTLASYRE
jgi:hypothetical protein